VGFVIFIPVIFSANQNTVALFITLSAEKNIVHLKKSRKKKRKSKIVPISLIGL
jgi:hypothetical protein